MHIQSIRFVEMLIVDVHFNTGKNWEQNIIYMSNKKNSILFLRRLFLFCLCLIFVLLFYFFAFVSFVTTTPEKFQFQSQVRLSQINVIVPIRLKFKIFAVFIGWESRLDFLFMVRQDIANYRDIPSKNSRNCHKSLVPKITWHEQWDMFVKMSLHHRLTCFADFVGMILLAVLFLLPSLNCLFQSLLSHTLCSSLEILSATNNFCNFWHNKFQQVSTYAFCSWDDIFTPKMELQFSQ